MAVRERERETEEVEMMDKWMWGERGRWMM